MGPRTIGRPGEGRPQRCEMIVAVTSALALGIACRAPTPPAPPEPVRHAGASSSIDPEPRTQRGAPDEPAKIASAPAPRTLATGGIYNCVVRSGRVYCWGLDRNHPPGKAFAIDGIEDAVEVAAGYEGACARTGDGQVLCWTESAQLPVEGVVATRGIAVGQSFACAAEERGVRCWSPYFSKKNPPEPRKVYGVKDPVQVAAGFYHACALEQGGEVKCWGGDPQGALGVETSAVPTFDQGRANDFDWVAQVIDDRGNELEFESFWKRPDRLQHRLLGCIESIGGSKRARTMELEIDLRSNGVVADVRLSSSEFGAHATEVMSRCVTRAYFAAPAIRPIAGTPVTIGARLFFQPPGQALRRAHRVTADAVAIASRGYFTCAVKANGGLECWGITHAFDGPGIHGTRWQSPGSPALVESVSELQTVSIGWRHVCGQRGDGTHLCFGGNEDGGFGAGIPATAEFSVRDIDADRHYREISAGPTLSCGVRTDDSVWCWGINDGGRLGTGSANEGVNAPAPVVGLPNPP